MAFTCNNKAYLLKCILSFIFSVHIKRVRQELSKSNKVSLTLLKESFTDSGKIQSLLWWKCINEAGWTCFWLLLGIGLRQFMDSKVNFNIEMLLYRATVNVWHCQVFNWNLCRGWQPEIKYTYMLTSDMCYTFFPLTL